VCHQTVSLVARHLEADGLPTVVVGSARDIVEHCGVPRFLFTDFPLGNPCGHPWNRAMQTAILRHAVSLFDAASRPRSTLRAPFEWTADDPDWRDRYARVRPEDRAALLALGDARRRQRGQKPRAEIDG
jgi:D-proline reductase (dithiol) PrdB